MSDLAAAIQERLRGLFPELLGIRFTEVTPERVVAELTVRPDLCTAAEVMHGGAIMAFADTLGAVGTIANLPAGARTTTIESKTNFVSAAPVGSRVLGESTPAHRGKTTMVWQTRISSESGKLLALVTQTQMVLPAPV
ncbi:MAG TPA: PaaI family thioesterase [Burkholderiales bacterium]|nr:PaaI family thioesterase [Burkholderiales bacterium]